MMADAQNSHSMFQMNLRLGEPFTGMDIFKFPASAGTWPPSFFVSSSTLSICVLCDRLCTGRLALGRSRPSCLQSRVPTGLPPSSHSCWGKEKALACAPLTQAVRGGSPPACACCDCTTCPPNGLAPLDGPAGEGAGMYGSTRGKSSFAAVCGSYNTPRPFFFFFSESCHLSVIFVQ